MQTQRGCCCRERPAQAWLYAIRLRIIVASFCLSQCVCVRALCVDTVYHAHNRYAKACAQVCPPGCRLLAAGCWLLAAAPWTLTASPPLHPTRPKHAPRPSMAACRALPSSAGWNLRPRPSGPVLTAPSSALSKSPICAVSLLKTLRVAPPWQDGLRMPHSIAASDAAVTCHSSPPAASS